MYLTASFAAPFPFEPIRRPKDPHYVIYTGRKSRADMRDLYHM